MPQEEMKTGRKKRPPASWKAITGNIGKIVGLITVVGALITGIAQITGGARELTRIWRPDTGCLTAEMAVLPTVVPIRQWNTVKFHLTGWNKCRETLEVHVAYKAQSETVRVEPPFKGLEQAACSGYDNAECWEARSLDGRKEINWTLIPPKLTALSPLSDPVKIEINWIVYNTETKKRVRAGKAEITVKGGNEA